MYYFRYSCVVKTSNAQTSMTSNSWQLAATVVHCGTMGKNFYWISRLIDEQVFTVPYTFCNDFNTTCIFT